MGPIRVMLSDAGVTEQQWRVLRVLDENGPMDPTSIADQAVLLLPSLTRILQKLESKGLVTRIQSETDRRRQVVSVTPEGSALISANLEASIQIFDQLRMQMGEDRYDALLDLLSELNDLDI
ncbi:homoprotocatechuate degradation operon regulator, HpaR [Salinihabitans flavidus]|uniref:Homoprotocatechuate degradation operon regulator, HpaR n=2 Tax=Salinihabitans flavidus TaxID=569882 RepID=A0A1H8LIF0_9RHOB|nr:homoprotocatechuate degradation operon regulator, HpaR [Salinihabitans flavidus]